MTEVPENIRKQYRKPEGEDGRAVLVGMNEHHVPLWDWCIGFLPRSIDGAVLDIGCGGGGFMSRLINRYPYAMFFGADVSEEALSMTMSVNSGTYDEGGLELHQASVDDLPFEDGTIDIVTAMETYFFWPDLSAGLREIARVLSAGGLVAIGSEMQLRGDNRDEMEMASELYGTRLVEDDEMIRLMDEAGFDVTVRTNPDNSWVLFVGTRRF